MPVAANCPQCGKSLRIPDERAQSRVRSPGCQTVFIPAGARAAGVATAPAVVKPLVTRPKVAPATAKVTPVENNPWAGLGSEPADNNPYASPTVITTHDRYGETGDVITGGVKRVLAETRPWVLIMAILGFIGCALLTLTGLVSLAGSGFVGLGILLSAVLYFFASYYLLRYAGRIAAFVRSGSPRQLQEALAAQKSFWKLVGIVTIVSLVLYILMIIAVFWAVGSIRETLRERDEEEFSLARPRAAVIQPVRAESAN